MGQHKPSSPQHEHIDGSYKTGTGWLLRAPKENKTKGNRFIKKRKKEDFHPTGSNLKKIYRPSRRSLRSLLGDRAPFFNRKLPVGAFKGGYSNYRKNPEREAVEGFLLHKRRFRSPSAKQPRGVLFKNLSPFGL